MGQLTITKASEAPITSKVITLALYVIFFGIFNL